MQANQTEKKIPEDVINDHFENQRTLAKTLEEINSTIASTFKADFGGKFAPLRRDLKAELSRKLSTLKTGEKHAVLLVDIQNDFILKDFALSKVDRTQVVYHNMALLTAISELVAADTTIKDKLEIVTSQDGHVLNRDDTSHDSEVIKAAHQNDALAVEKTEMLPLDPTKGQFGPHCVVGTVGADIVGPIDELLKELEHNRINVTRFLKINFDGTKSGVKMKPGIKLSEVDSTTSELLESDPNASYLAFFKNKKFKEIFITGIAGEVCVTQAAHGLRKALSGFITVIEACTQYLNYPQAADQAKNTPAHNTNNGVAIEKGYRAAGIGIMKMASGAASNAYNATNDFGVKYDDKIEAISSMFAFYLRHPKACNAVLELIALSAVALAAFVYATALAPVNLTIAAAVATTTLSLAVVGIFNTRAAANHTIVPMEPTPTPTL